MSTLNTTMNTHHTTHHPPQPQQPTRTMQIHDIAIIGAGPSGLAVAARLREPSPSVLFTDTEHARFWNRSHDRNTIEHHHRHRRSTSSVPTDKYSMVVFDATSEGWMAGWREKFARLGIEELRSPLFFHPDPGERDGLLAFAYEKGRQGELREIEGVVGRESSKHAAKKKRERRGRERPVKHLDLDNRDRNDYFTASAALFDDYVDEIVGRYGLAALVRRASIVDVQYGFVAGSGDEEKLFTLTSADGERNHARVVIVATGPPPPEIPRSIPLLRGPNERGSASHIFESSGQLVPTLLFGRLQARSTQPIDIAIVGGGLSSAQVAILLLHTYSSQSNLKVHLILRSKLKVKHFDIDLPWVAKLRNRQMAEFWSADSDAERFAMLKEAKGGGSVTAKYAKMMKVEEARGRLIVHQGWEIDTAGEPENGETTSWNNDIKAWRVILRSSGHARSPKHSHMALEDPEIKYRTIQNVRHVFFATSTPPNINTLPFLHGLGEAYPLKNINGLPILTEDLRIHSELPLFVTGAFAGLRLGPGAGNLGGARLGAERIAWAIDETFADTFAATEQRRSTTEVHIDNVREAVLEVRRDSGYSSEDQNVIERVVQTKAIDAIKKESLGLDERDKRDALNVRYIDGVGNCFQALTLLQE